MRVFCNSLTLLIEYYNTTIISTISISGVSNMRRVLVLDTCIQLPTPCLYISSILIYIII